MTNNVEPSSKSVLLVGGPDAGKTNYLARAWMALDQGKGLVRRNGFPPQVEYLRQIAAALMKGDFAPHTPRAFLQETVIPVKWGNGQEERGDLIIPDCSGERWEKIAETRTWSDYWEQAVASLAGCILFFRAGSSHGVQALDCTCDGEFLRQLGAHADVPGDPAEGLRLPTQVLLVDWLQCLHEAFTATQSELDSLRLSVIVAAWDKVPREMVDVDPLAYLDQEVPLLCDFIAANAHSFDTRVFGVSVVGGDLQAQPGFKDAFLRGQPYESGFVQYSNGQDIVKETDLTIPIAWALGCSLPNVARPMAENHEAN